MTAPFRPLLLVLGVRYKAPVAVVGRAQILAAAVAGDRGFAFNGAKRNIDLGAADGAGPGHRGVIDLAPYLCRKDNIRYFSPIDLYRYPIAVILVGIEIEGDLKLSAMQDEMLQSLPEFFLPKQVNKFEFIPWATPGASLNFYRLIRDLELATRPDSKSQAFTWFGPTSTNTPIHKFKFPWFWYLSPTQGHDFQIDQYGRQGGKAEYDT